MADPLSFADFYSQRNKKPVIEQTPPGVVPPSQPGQEINSSEVPSLGQSFADFYTNRRANLSQPQAVQAGVAAPVEALQPEVPVAPVPAPPLENVAPPMARDASLAGPIPRPTPDVNPEVMSQAPAMPQAPAPLPAPMEEAPPPDIFDRIFGEDDRSMAERIIDPFGTTRAAYEGAAQGFHGALAAAGRTVGADNFAAQQAEIAASKPSPPRMREIASVNDAARWLYGLLGQSAPELVAVTGAAAVGTLGSPVVVPALAGLGTSMLFATGHNLERQEQETGETSYGRALAAALPQAGLDILPAGKILGVFGSRLAGAGEQLVQKGLVREVTEDSVLEGATETVQSLIEIGQASPELLRILVAPRTPEEMQKSDELLMELVESAVGGAAAGGTLSGVVNSVRGAGPSAESIGQNIDLGKFSDEDLGAEPGQLLIEGPKEPLLLPPPSDEELGRPPKAKTPPEVQVPFGGLPGRESTPMPPQEVLPPTNVPDAAEVDRPLNPPYKNPQDTLQKQANRINLADGSLGVTLGKISQLTPQHLLDLEYDIQAHGERPGAFMVAEQLSRHGVIDPNDKPMFYDYLMQHSMKWRGLVDPALPPEQRHSYVAATMKAYESYKEEKALVIGNMMREGTEAKLRGQDNIWDLLDGVTPDMVMKSPRLQTLTAIASTLVNEHNKFGRGGGTDVERIVGRKAIKEVLDAFRDIGAPAEMAPYIGKNASLIERKDVNKLLRSIKNYGWVRQELNDMGLTHINFNFDNTQPSWLGYWLGANNTLGLNPDKYSFKPGTPYEVAARATLGHEMLHALSSIGVFDSGRGQRAWNILVDHFNTVGIPQTVKDRYEPAVWMEEAIAELVGGFYNLKQSTLQGRKRGLSDMVMDAIKYLLKGYEIVEKFFNTHADINRLEMPQDALELITSGKLKKETEALLDRQFRQFFPRQYLEGVNPQILDKATTEISKALGTNNPMARSAIRNADYFNSMVKWGWNILQLGKKNKHIVWLQDYISHADRWYNEKSRWLHRANETVTQWNKLSSKEQENLSQFIFEVEKMNYRTPQEIARKVIRLPTRNELGQLAQRFNLTPRAVATYVKVRADFRAVLDKLEAITIAEIRRTVSNPIAAGLDIAQVRQEFSFLKKKPYFPHARFGQYTIVVKDNQKKTVYVEAFENEGARNKSLADIRSRFGPGYSVASSKFDEVVNMFQGLPPSLVTKLVKDVNLTIAQKAQLEELMIAMAPTQSFKKHFLHRSDMPGYSRDTLRAYGDYFMHAANHIARLEFVPFMEEAMTDGLADVQRMRSTDGTDSTKRVKMLEYLQHHLDNIKNPKPEWSAIRSAGFLFWLGFNVKSAVMNFTQIPMVTFPFLSAHFGEGAATKQMTIAMKHFSDSFKKPQNVRNYNSNPANMRAVNQGLDEGILDESFAAMLAGIAEGGNILRAKGGSAMHRGMLHFQTAAAYMFQATEKMNRRITFMAALELARKNPTARYLTEVATLHRIQLAELVNKGWPQEEALAYLAAKDAVRSTQFEYSSWARPRFMEGQKGMFFTFMSFAQNMLWFYKNSPGGYRALLILLALGGVMGLPGADDMEEMIKWLGRQFDKNWNFEKELREFSIELLGDEVPPDLLLKGISRNSFGLPAIGDMMGVPVPSFDLSGNIGMGSPFPIVSPLIQGATYNGDFNDKVAKMTQEGSGASIGIGFGIATALMDSKLPADDMKRWEKAMPAAGASLSKAYRYWNEGAEKTRTGGIVAKFEPSNYMHMAEILGTAAGFRPTRVAREWDEIIMKREVEVFWDTRRGMIFGMYHHAKTSGDPEEIKNALLSAKKFNDEVPFPDLKFSRKKLETSHALRDKNAAKQSAGLPQAKMMRGVYKDIERLHPESNITEAQEELKPVK